MGSGGQHDGTVGKVVERTAAMGGGMEGFVKTVVGGGGWWRVLMVGGRQW